VGNGVLAPYHQHIVSRSPSNNGERDSSGVRVEHREGRDDCGRILNKADIPCQFNLRIDPAIDGHNNTLSYVDSVPMPQDPSLNPYGTGYMTKETKITTSSTVKTDPLAARIFKISNPSKINPVSLAPVAYKLVPISSQVLLANTDSWHHRRADFCDAPIWVTKYNDRELFPAGDYTNPSSGGEGIRSWVARNDNVENEVGGRSARARLV
jgi:Cu2+-containing amine oxidase